MDVDLLPRSARERAAPPISPPLCLFPARCWIGSINETTLKTNDAEASSPPQLLPVHKPFSQSAGRTTGSRHLGVSWRRSPRLMCYLERRRCDWRGGVNEVDKRAEPRGKTGSREPGSVSESHGARAPARTEQDVVAAGPPAPPGTERREDRGGPDSEVFCSCFVKTSRHVILSGCRRVKTSFFHRLIARSTGEPRGRSGSPEHIKL